MLNRLLSHDLPKSRWLAAALLLIVIALALAPFLFPGAKALSVAAKMLVFIVLVASFDLLLGYTGIVSFAHTMFFGIGAYGVAIASTRLGEGWIALVVGLACALVVSLLLSLLIGLFSLRVKAIFYAMITLAVAAAFQTLASQLSDFTGGEDGLSFKNPRWLSPSFEPLAEPLFGLTIDGKVITYYLLFVAAALLFLLLLRIVNSPFGRVLQAIRENDFRAEAIGYRSVVYRTLSNVLAAAVRDARRRAAGAVAALHRPRHHAVVRGHARHSAHRRHRRHGHAVRRGDRQRAVRAGAELPAGPAQARRHSARRRAAARRRGHARPLAALARRALRAVGVPLSKRCGRTTAGPRRAGLIALLSLSPKETELKTKLNAIAGAVKLLALASASGALLGGCWGDGPSTNFLPAGITQQGVTVYPATAVGSGTTAATQDLLTAGLGKTGIGGAAPAYADPLAPTALELRRNAIYSNYRGLVDFSAAGGYGTLVRPERRRQRHRHRQ